MTIAYIRTYSNKQQTESQKNAIEQFAKAKKIEIDKWLKDAKNSSKEKNRLEDVIKNLQEGDILIVADVTRLSRKLMEIMHLILLCIEKKVALYCIKEGYSFEDNVNSKTLAFTFGLVSEIESKLISARTKEALTASKNKGTKLGRPLGSPKTEFLLSQKSQIERELKEETGLTIDVVKPAYTFTKIRKDYQTVGIGYLASTDDDHVSISFEHTDYKWCSIDELKDYLCDEIYQDIIYTLKEYTSI